MYRILSGVLLGLLALSPLYGAGRAWVPQFTATASEGVAVSTTGWVKTGTNIHQATLTDKVGIGTTNPAEPLEVFSTVNASTISIVGGENEPAAIVMWADDGDAAGDKWAIAAQITDNLQFSQFVGANYTPRVTFRDGGNVGIGTTNPGSKLHMSSGVFTIDGSGATAIDLYDGSLEKKVGGIGTFNDDMTIFSSNNRDIDFQDDSGVIVTFQDGGNVGIGTALPAEALDVSGAVRVTGPTAGTTADSVMLDFSGTGGRVLSRGADASTRGTITLLQTTSNGGSASSSLHINKDANVGIGTSNPGSKFSVNGGSMTLTESNGATSVSGEGSIGIYNPNTIAGAIIGLDFWGQTNSGARQISGSIGMKNTGGGGNARGDFFIATGDATLTERLSITNGGAATFSSSMTVNGEGLFTGVDGATLTIRGGAIPDADINNDIAVLHFDAQNGSGGADHVHISKLNSADLEFDNGVDDPRRGADTVSLTTFNGWKLRSATIAELGASGFNPLKVGVMMFCTNCVGTTPSETAGRIVVSTGPSLGNYSMLDGSTFQ